MTTQGYDMRLAELNQAVLDLLPAAAYVCEAGGAILRCNRRAVSLWGLSPSSTDRYSGALRLFRCDGSALAPGDTAIGRVLQGAPPGVDTDILIERADGTRVAIEEHVEPIYDDTGRIAAAVDLLIDVTGRRELEPQSSDAASRVQLALDVAEVGTYDWNLQTNEVVRSANATHMLGLVAQGPSATRSEFLMCVHPDDRDRVRQLEADALAGRRPFDTEYRIVRPDGDERWFADRARVFRAGDGRPLRMVGARMDVTERRRVEAALRVSEQRLQLALEAGRLGSWEYQVATGVLTASAQCRANHGLAPDDRLTLDDVLEAMPPAPRAEFAAALQRAIETRGSFWMEVPNVWPDGTRHWLLICARSVDATSMVGVTQDVTERRNSEERFADMNRRKDVFMATLAHELRQPLSPMVTALSLMRARTGQESGERARHVLERQVQQLMRLVDDLSDSARIAQGKVQLKPALLDLREAIADAVHVVLPHVEARRQQFHVDLPPDAVMVNGDRERLQQVFSNLLLNAAKYTGEEGTIALGASVVAEDALITVRDTGRGIPADLLPQIFDMFMQADSESGLGIGLPVVRRLVELHGGTVVARSRGAGCGSEFVIVLPLSRAATV